MKYLRVFFCVFLGLNQPKNKKIAKNTNVSILKQTVFEQLMQDIKNTFKKQISKFLKKIIIILKKLQTRKWEIDKEIQA